MEHQEAIAIVLDVGYSMHNDVKGSHTVLHKAKTCINMILQRKIFSESKDEVALVLFGTHETSNNLATTGKSEYCHVKVAQDLKPANWELLHYVSEIEGTDLRADFIDALVVAMDILHIQTNGQENVCQRILFISNFGGHFCEDQLSKICEGIKFYKMELNIITFLLTFKKVITGNALLVAMDLLQNALNGKKFFSRRILFLSHFDDTFCGDKVNRICEDLKTLKIDLNLIGPIAFTDEGDIDSSSQMYQNRTPQQIKTHNVVQKILKEVNGESYSFSEALPALIYYQKKKVQAMPWNANLDIGKNLTIPISAYIKVNETKAKPWKNAYAHKLNAKIEKETLYHLEDDEQTEVSKDNIIPACRYGTTLVPYTEEDKINMEYQSGEKGMKVLGFTKAENVHKYHSIGDKSMYVFGQKNRELAGVILAPFIHALHETKMVTIVRYVYSARTAPKIGFLAPRIKKDYECLIFVILPFMEDLRHFVFAPLDSDPKSLPTSKILPTNEQLGAVDSLITSMDLSTAAVDEDGNRGEGLKPKNTVNPYLQRLYQCLQHRTFNPEKPLPEIASHISTIINPSPELLEKAGPVLKEIKSVFPLKVIAETKTFDSGSVLFSNGKSENVRRKRKKSDVDDKGEEPAQKIVSTIGDKIVEVGSIKPAQDFAYLINESDKNFREICKQLETVIHLFLIDAEVTLHYGKIVDCIKAYRNAAILKQDPFMFNVFLEDIKNLLITKQAELWKFFESEKISLITNEDCQSSTVSVVESQQFISNTPLEITFGNSSKAVEIDEEDLLDQM